MATTFLAGQNFTAANANNIAGITCKVKSTDNSLPNNTTTLTNDGELILPVSANTKYALLASIHYDSSTAADLKLFFTTPAGSTLAWTTFGLDGAATAVFGNLNVGAGVGVTGVVAGAGVGTRVACLANGSIVTGASAGNVQLQFAQNVSDASTTTLRSGSWVMLTASN